MVLWMLQHHLLMQLHTYVQFMPTDHGECTKPPEIKSTNTINNDNVIEVNPPKMDESMETSDEPTESANGNENGQAFGSLLSVESSQPVPVPKNSACRSISEDRFSEMAADSNISDNIDAPASSSNKSNYSISQSDTMSTENCESLASVEDEDKIKELLMAFQEPERSAVRDLPAASNVEDLTLMVKLYQAGMCENYRRIFTFFSIKKLRVSKNIYVYIFDCFRLFQGRTSSRRNNVF